MKRRNATRWLVLSLLCGLLAGLSAYTFLTLLHWVTQLRIAHTEFIWGLPIAGLLIGWLFHHYGQPISGGTSLILDEIHDPKNTLPIRMAPLILIGTLLTHLFGGSAGREGTAVQISAALSDQLSRLVHITPQERKVLLIAGAGAGFGAAIGVPLAGAIFGMEISHKGRFRIVALTQCVIASFSATYFAAILGAPHTVYPHILAPLFTLKTLAIIALSGLAFGLAARGFIALTHGIEWLQTRFIPYPPLRPAIGGALLAVFFVTEHAYRYAGLGLPVISHALQSPGSILDPLIKLGVTALTIGSGFKGGEFIPLVFIGTTLGSALSVILPVSVQLLAGVGFVAVFAAAANAPIACAIMAIELFGIGIAPYVIVACLCACLVSGQRRIYKQHITPTSPPDSDVARPQIP